MTAKDKSTSEPAAGRAEAECDTPTSTEIQKVAAQFRALSNWLLCGSRNTSFHVGNDMDFAYRKVELSNHRRNIPPSWSRIRHLCPTGVRNDIDSFFSRGLGPAIGVGDHVHHSAMGVKAITETLTNAAVILISASGGGPHNGGKQPHSIDTPERPRRKHGKDSGHRVMRNARRDLLFKHLDERGGHYDTLKTLRRDIEQETGLKEGYSETTLHNLLKGTEYARRHKQCGNPHHAARAPGKRSYETEAVADDSPADISGIDFYTEPDED